MADIFLSYSRADADTTDRLAKALASLGWAVWWDTEIRAGEEWSSTIEAAAREARCVVVLWSQTSVTREWVHREATIGLERKRLVPMLLDRGLSPPSAFDKWQAKSLATWDGTTWHPEFQRLVRELEGHLGPAPRGNPPHPLYPPYAREILGKERPDSVAALALPRSTQYFPSPRQWSDEVLYLLLPDRFSDGQEKQRKLLDRGAIQRGQLDGAGIVPLDAWAISGKDRWQGGTIAGVTSKLGYLQGLGVTTIWMWPVFKQRSAAGTYHGYAPQDFLEVDPRFGARQDLVELVAQAHDRKMHVILSGELHHSGTNWSYRDRPDGDVLPYTAGRHPFGAWFDENEQPLSRPASRNDAVWPRELQDPDCYFRAGQGRLGPDEDDYDNPDAEFRRSDFFALRTFDPARTLDTIIACHRYWIALTDCDGLFLDLASQEPRRVLNPFCGAIREYAARLGKHNFLVLGEVYGSIQDLETHYEYIGRTLHGSMSAILDNGPMRLTLHAVAKGHEPASSWFNQFGERGGELGVNRALGSRHVSILDDADGVFGEKLRFACSADESQIAVALAVQLFSLGIPCIYYGTEQALGQHPSHGQMPPLGWGQSDAFLREAMFGPEHPRTTPQSALVQDPAQTDRMLPGFGPLGTAGRHAFDQESPLYQKIAGLAATRRRFAALRSGRQYAREVDIGDGLFKYPRAGEVFAWSRILDDEEVVCVVNPNGDATKSARVVVDVSMNPDGSPLQVVFATAKGEIATAGKYHAGTVVRALRETGVAYLSISELPPGAVVVLSNRAE